MFHFYSIPAPLGPSPLEPLIKPLLTSEAEQKHLRALFAAQEAFEATLTPYQREVAAGLRARGLGRFEAAISASLAQPPEVLGQ